MSFAHSADLRNSFSFVQSKAQIQIMKKEYKMQKFQFNMVNSSSSISSALREIIGAFRRKTLGRVTAQSSQLSASIQYDIGEDDIRPLTDERCKTTELDTMLLRSI